MIVKSLVMRTEEASSTPPCAQPVDHEEGTEATRGVAEKAAEEGHLLNTAVEIAGRCAG